MMVFITIIFIDCLNSRRIINYIFAILFEIASSPCNCQKLEINTHQRLSQLKFRCSHILRIRAIRFHQLHYYQYINVITNPQSTVTFFNAFSEVEAISKDNFRQV